MCSWCGQDIDEEVDGEDEGLAIRMWNANEQEARFHPRCLRQAIEAMVIRMV